MTRSEMYYATAISDAAIGGLLLADGHYLPAVGCAGIAWWALRRARGAA